MRTTICTCDRCKKEVSAAELSTITLRISNSSWINKTFDICKDCRVETNIEDYTEDQRKRYFENKVEPPTPTLEQLILDILHNDIAGMISDQLQNR